MTDFKEGGAFDPPPSHSWAAPKLHILDKVKGRLVIEINVNSNKFYITLWVTRNQSHKLFERFCSNLDLFLSSINNQHPNDKMVK